MLIFLWVIIMNEKTLQAPLLLLFAIEDLVQNQGCHHDHIVIHHFGHEYKPQRHDLERPQNLSIINENQNKHHCGCLQDENLVHHEGHH